MPLEWYDEFDHVGYDLEGRKIMRGARKDELDALIDRFDNPNASRTIHDYGARRPMPLAARYPLPPACALMPEPMMDSKYLLLSTSANDDKRFHQDH